MAPETALDRIYGVSKNLLPLQDHLPDEIGMSYRSSEHFELETEHEKNILRLLIWKLSVRYLRLPAIHILHKNMNMTKVTLQWCKTLEEDRPYQTLFQRVYKSFHFYRELASSSKDSFDTLMYNEGSHELYLLEIDGLGREYLSSGVLKFHINLVAYLLFLYRWI